MNRSAPWFLVFLFSSHFAYGDSLDVSSTSGPVTAVVRLEPAEPKTGDVIRLTLEVTADHDVEATIAIQKDSIADMRIRSFIPSQRVEPNQRLTTLHRYELDAKLPGPVSIPPIKIEYTDYRSTDGKSAETDHEEFDTLPLPFTIQSVLGKEEGAELGAPLGEIPPTSAPTRVGWWRMGIALAVALALGVTLKWLSRPRRLVQESSFERANRRLDRLSLGTFESSSSVDSLYTDLSSVIRDYVEQTFGVCAPKQTTEELLQSLASNPEVGDSGRELLPGLLRAFDQVKFGQGRPTQETIAATFAETRRFLMEAHQHDLATKGAGSAVPHPDQNS